VAPSCRRAGSGAPAPATRPASARKGRITALSAGLFHPRNAARRPPACVSRSGHVFVLPHMSPPVSLADLLQALGEPTRLRILNCLQAAPLFVSDLVLILDLPQPTVSRHLRVLRD